MNALTRLLADPRVSNFARELAENIAKRYPPAIDQDPSKRPSVNRMTRIVEDACRQAREFQLANRLGWIGKARLGNSFRWALTEMGYRSDFVDLATEAIVVEISRKPPQQ
jgi:hypothetical protein